MNEKQLRFINDICMAEGISQSSRCDRIYAAMMYMVNVEGSISAVLACRIMDMVKDGATKIRMEDIR